jgi:amino-acid N-acetyltransferase
MKASDLRGILGYIARFRDKIFILNIDSAVLASDNFTNLLLDISVLRSLNIKLVLVHGASTQIRELSRETQRPASDYNGMGVTDADTLHLAILASNRLGHDILEGLADSDQRAVITNAVIAHPAGIIGGVDQQWTGQVEKVDAAFLQSLISDGIIPVLPALGFDGNGQTYRVNSDGVALAVSEALKAAKLMFITTSNGVKPEGSRDFAQFSVDAAEEYLRKYKNELTPDMMSKLKHGIRACRNGVLRVHIIDGTQDEALLNEVFSNKGVGTMIHANEYEAIRPARKKDAGLIYNLIRESIDAQQIMPRSRKEIVEQIQEFFVFEIDRNILGCVGLRSYDTDQGKLAELECLCVDEKHTNQGIGHQLMHYIENEARERMARRLLVLSTQAFNYFQQKGGFREGGVDLLPPERRTAYDASKRRSKILYKDL